MTLVGNKSDLHMQRKITKEEGQAVAAEWGCAWIEASADIMRMWRGHLNFVEKANKPPQEEKSGCVIL
jgi:Ras family protein